MGEHDEFVNLLTTYNIVMSGILRLEIGLRRNGVESYSTGPGEVLDTAKKYFDEYEATHDIVVQHKLMNDGR